MDKSLEGEDNSVPHLPDTSAGSSVSTDLENEYNDLIQYTVVLPANQFDLSHVPKVLENTKGLFSTNYVQGSATNNVKSSNPVRKNDTNKSNETDDDEDEANNHAFFSSKDLDSVKKLNDDFSASFNLNKHLVSIVDTSKFDYMEYNHLKNALNESLCSNSSHKSILNKQDENNNNNSLLKIYTDTLLPQINKEIKSEKSNENEILLLFETKTTAALDQHQKDQHHSSGIETVMSSTSTPSMVTTPATSSSASSLNNSNRYADANPRKQSKSLYPASPPNNIELDMSSIETINNNCDNSTNNSKNSNEFVLKTNSSVVDPNEERRFSLNNSNVSEELITQPHMVSSKNIKQPNKNVSNQSPNKNVKIATCLDKWYKELKGNVLSEFEKSRVQMLQDQQKQLVEDKERQAQEITKLKKELEIMRETLKVYERNTLKKDDTCQNLTKALEKQTEKMDLQRVMLEWKIEQMDKAKELFTSKLAEKYYKQRIKLKIFLSWHCLIVSKQKAKFEKNCKKKAEEICVELATKYESKIKSLEQDLNTSKQEIEKLLIEKSPISVNESNLDTKMTINPETEFNKISANKKTKSKSSSNQNFHRNVASNYKESDLYKLSNSELNKNLKYYYNSATSGANKFFDELTQHNFPHQKELSIKTVAKTGKLDMQHISIPTNSGTASIRQSLPPYRSVIIEKHSSLASSSSSTYSPPMASSSSGTNSLYDKAFKNTELVKSMTTKVKYNAPGQPCNVLNTVVNSSSN